eukprot:CAMPEP_0179990542 /NCGR_PEP_ID=MMETSP0984-20121128/4525_1 /TAXON_ID=483367 /ORGANISM="non described non described, Strain CCMP 2436" /LENGTH=124 /DNA_ID=CAMNT_0021909809 /DNA_START=363 /DNA_END=734 /DNA_ORIENTATION=-
MCRKRVEDAFALAEGLSALASVFHALVAAWAELRLVLPSAVLFVAAVREEAPSSASSSTNTTSSSSFTSSLSPSCTTSSSSSSSKRARERSAGACFCVLPPRRARIDAARACGRYCSSISRSTG